jgi:hypothetical protein
MDSSMDWMYEGPGGQESLNDKATEDYLLGTTILHWFAVMLIVSYDLLGKIYKAKATEQTDLHTISKFSHCTISARILRHERDVVYTETESAAGALWLNKVNAKNDSFTRLHEDPLLAIKQREKQVWIIGVFAYVFVRKILAIYLFADQGKCSEQPSQDGKNPKSISSSVGAGRW